MKTEKFFFSPGATPYDVYGKQWEGFHSRGRRPGGGEGLCPFCVPWKWKLDRITYKGSVFNKLFILAIQLLFHFRHISNSNAFVYLFFVDANLHMWLFCRCRRPWNAESALLPPVRHCVALTTFRVSLNGAFRPPAGSARFLKGKRSKWQLRLHRF